MGTTRTIEVTVDLLMAQRRNLEEAAAALTAVRARLGPQPRYEDDSLADVQRRILRAMEIVREIPAFAAALTGVR